MSTAQYSGLRGIFLIYLAELVQILGLGHAKAVRVNVALGLGRYLAALACGAHVYGGKVTAVA